MQPFYAKSSDLQFVRISIYGHEVRSEKGKVEKWLKSLTPSPSPNGEGSK